MYYIDDYRKRAVNTIIPYLIEFPDIIKIIENSADRYQAIEDVLWQIATNFKVEDSRGIFLNAHANNEVVDIIYTDKAEDAFTYGTDKPLYQAYGTGHYYSQASYISGIKKTFSEDKLIRAVLAKILQNNTDATIEELIEGLKLLYNAEHVSIHESNPLNISILLSGNSLELSSSGNYENIKQMLPACVKLNNLYVNPYTYNIFKYDKQSSYGDTRYPVRVGETVDVYNYISYAIPLRSIDNEYIVTKHNKFNSNMFCVICGQFESIKNNKVLISSNTDADNGFNLITVDTDGRKYIAIEYNGQIYNSDFEINTENTYTFILYNSGTKLSLWAQNGIGIKGKYDEDSSYILKNISFLKPLIDINTFTTIDAPIYINCKNIGAIQSEYSDFIYYALIFGANEDKNANITEYYNTCYGEKQILFNCIDNKNHLNINTTNSLIKDITVKQSYYNYKYNYSNGKYIYLDGKSGIDYKVNDKNIDCDIDEFEICFDICQPTGIREGVLLNNILNNYEDQSNISIDANGSIWIYFKELDENGDFIQTFYNTPDNTIEESNFSSYRIKHINKKIYFYKNNTLIGEYDTIGTFKNIPNIFKIGYNNDLSSFYKGFIKNVKLTIKAHKDTEEYNIDLNIPLDYSLQNTNNINSYTNYGARFITTPQLMNDTTNLDIYGNNLIGKRN